MPAFYALAQHAALADLQSQLLDGEAILAFLDDVYIVAAPERVRTLYDALAAALWHRARIRFHEGKTRIWNSAGEEPTCILLWSASRSAAGLVSKPCNSCASSLDTGPPLSPHS